MGPVERSVVAAIEGLSEADRLSWRAEAARTAAAEFDAKPVASMLGELRRTMAELTAEQVPQEASPVDDLARRRAERIAAAQAQ